ncbi:HAD family hydrolase [Thalassoroseus pseudoceratinae]|uniref:HAD family hydrolase n=1 Tax=Thalassoroseus pseudoceratinae TaxID=2713176 RepID=UPI0014232115|nr:HAD family hydrolase [Thalassoroseus pseudoceratinae]
MRGIRAVVFDIYGTLLISGSGDIGSADDNSHHAAFQDALNAVGIREVGDIAAVERAYREAIGESHDESRSNGISYPEVEICEVWKHALQRLTQESVVPPLETNDELLAKLAIEYEVLANPAWPMPNCAATLTTLRDAGLELGIISNAQFFTPDLFPSLLRADLDELGFDPALRFYSYQYRQAKPGTFLYEKSQQALAKLGISPEEALYVGNDMLKDIWPAQQVGFRTALFAGDARSLRLRTDDDRVQHVTPNAVITDLAQIPQLVGLD